MYMFKEFGVITSYSIQFSIQIIIDEGSVRAEASKSELDICTV